MSAVLLYYKYIDLSEGRDAVTEWMRGQCADLQLKGRVRMAFDGINVTVRPHAS
jgi:predicted sulfurtransferase